MKLFESLFPKKEPLANYATILSAQLIQANEHLTTGSYDGLNSAVGIFDNIRKTAKSINDTDAYSLSKQLYGESNTALRTFKTLLTQSSGYAPGFYPVHTRSIQERLGQHIGQLHQTYQKLSQVVESAKSMAQSSQAIDESSKELTQLQLEEIIVQDPAKIREERVSKLKSIFAEYKNGHHTGYFASELDEFNSRLTPMAESYLKLLELPKKPSFAEQVLDTWWCVGENPFSERYVRFFPPAQQYMELDKQVRELSEQRKKEVSHLEKKFSMPEKLEYSWSGNYRHIPGYQLDSYNEPVIRKNEIIVVDSSTFAELKSPIIQKYDSQILSLVEEREKLEPIIISAHKRFKETKARNITRAEYKYISRLKRTELRDTKLKEQADQNLVELEEKHEHA
jgi:hypothetical protein